MEKTKLMMRVPTLMWQWKEGHRCTRRASIPLYPGRHVGRYQNGTSRCSKSWVQGILVKWWRVTWRQEEAQRLSQLKCWKVSVLLEHCISSWLEVKWVCMSHNLHWLSMTPTCMTSSCFVMSNIGDMEGVGGRWGLCNQILNVHCVEKMASVPGEKIIHAQLYILKIFHCMHAFSVKSVLLFSQEIYKYMV